MTSSNICLNMIVGPVDERWIQYALDNVADDVAHAVINDNGGHLANRERIFQSRFAREGRLTYFTSSFENFSQARNLCLENMPPGEWDWLLRLDCDEVHYPHRFADLASRLADWASAGVSTIRIPFWHLLAPRIYQSYEECAQLFRWHPSLRWHGVVHETLSTHGVIIKAGEPFVHYSYCHPQPVVFGKWQQYSELEGDPEHYRRQGTQPETVIADRYATAGAPFREEHPPGAREYWAGEVAAGRARGGSEKMMVAIAAPEYASGIATLRHLQETHNADYPLAFTLVVPEALRAFTESAHGHEAEIVGIPAGAWADGRAWLAKFWSQGGVDWGMVLFLAGGAYFTTSGWQKALANAVFCLPEYDAYRPEGARETLLVARDSLGKEPGKWRVYASPFVRVTEP